MRARLADRVTYSYCMACGRLLLAARQAIYGGEVWHAWCAVTHTWLALGGQRDRRN